MPGVEGGAGPAVVDREDDEGARCGGEDDVDSGGLALAAQVAAAQTIELCWLRHCDRRVFARIKEALAQAEGAVADEVLRQLCPVEAGLLKDACLAPRVRFRLAGGEWPPRVVFKVYVSKGMTSVVYMSGKRMIQPASEAAADSARVMGRHRFLGLVLEDETARAAGVIDRFEVTSLQEYMQYASVTDGLDAGLGGRGNGWRPLLPEEQHGVLYDFVEYCHGGDLTARLQRHAPELGDDMVEPRSAEEEARIKCRALEARRRLSSAKGPQAAKLTGGERRRRLERMRQLYGLQGSPDAGPGSREGSPSAGAAASPTDGEPALEPGAALGDVDDGEEEEEDRLFRWSQELLADDPAVIAALNDPDI